MACLLVIALAVLFYVLYLQGILTIKSMGALSFFGSIRGNGRCSGSFTSCSGTLRRIMKFKESKCYHFSLNTKLEKGEVEVMVLNRARQPIVTLNSCLKTASAVIDSQSRYYLVFTFRSASGDYEFTWD